MHLRALAAGLALACLSSLALAQGVPLYQSGAATANHLPKFSGANGLLHDAGGVTGDANGKGVAPFSISDALALGLCANSAATSGQYNALCLGHDSSGNGLLTLDSYGGLANKTLYLRLNGTTYEFPFSLAGIAGPSSSTVSHPACWNNTTGSLVKDCGDGLRLGTVLSTGLLSVERTTSSATDAADTYVVRDANYTGGTSANINSAMSVNTTVRDSAYAYEWNGFFQLDNYGLLATGGENVGLYASGIKRSTGKTWGAVSQVTDYSTGVTSGSAIAHEFDMTANGADTSSNRFIIHLYANKSTGGTDPTLQAGINIAGSLANYIYGIRFDGTGANHWSKLFGLVNSASYDNGIDLSGGTCVNAQFVGTGFTVDCSGQISTAKPVVLKNYTVATLPTCNASLQYSIAAVSDATSPTYDGALTGGGAVIVPVFCNGSAWRSH